MRKYTKYSDEQKRNIMDQIKSGVTSGLTVEAAVAKAGIHVSTYHSWKHLFGNATKVNTAKVTFHDSSALTKTPKVTVNRSSDRMCLIIGSRSEVLALIKEL